MQRADHFAFEVSDMERAIRFYSEVLGFRLISQEVDEVHNEAFSFLELEGGNLELLQVLNTSNGGTQTRQEPPRPPYCPHLAVGTSDLESLARRLREQGVCIVKEPMEIEGYVRWMYIADPDGNVIEYVQWLR